MTFLELAHMLDATQLCFFGHCTHAGCYATVFVLSLHTCWMLRNCVFCHCTHAGCYATVFVWSLHTCWMLRDCVCLVIAHMLDATQLCFLVIAHMLDATQLCLSCHCTHAGCYAAVFFVIAHMLDATRLCLFCHCTHAGCYATVFVLSLRKCWMLRDCVCFVIVHMLDATQPCSKADSHAVPWSDMESIEKIHTERTSQPRPNHQTWQPSSGGICFGRFCSEWTRGRTCLKHWVNWPKKPTMRENGEETTSFFRRMVPIRTNSKLNAFVKTRTHGKNETKWTYEPTCHKLKSTPLQHFVHLQQNAMWISPRVAITAVTLF